MAVGYERACARTLELRPRWRRRFVRWARRDPDNIQLELFA
jgi:hypothetical protein